MLKFEKRGKRVSFAMRMSFPSEGSGPAHSYFEVPFDWPIEVECVQEVPHSRESVFIGHVTTEHSNPYKCYTDYYYISLGQAYVCILILQYNISLACVCNT